jgi:hypothetical protein
MQRQRGGYALSNFISAAFSCLRIAMKCGRPAELRSSSCIFEHAMPAIQTSLSIPTQPWETARARFLDGLSPQETNLYEDATLENIFYDTSSAHKQYTAGSRSSRLLDFLAPLLESLEDYGKAMDVFVNTQPLILSPLWGGLRVILQVSHTTRT